MITHVLLLGVLVPAAVAAVAAAALSRAPRARAAGAAALALALGYAAGHLAVLDWHGWWPVDVTHRLPHAALIAGLLGLVAMGDPGRRRFAPLIAAPVVAFILLNPLGGGMDGATYAGALLGATAALALHGALWGVAVHEQPAPLAGAVLVVAAATLAAAAAASGSILVGQLGGVVAASAGAIAATATVPRMRMGLVSMAATAAVTMGGLAILAGAYSSTAHPVLLLWGLVPAAVWGARKATRHAKRRWVAPAAQVLAALLIGGSAAAWAALPDPPPREGTGDDGGEYDYGYGYD